MVELRNLEIIEITKDTPTSIQLNFTPTAIILCKSLIGAKIAISTRSPGAADMDKIKANEQLFLTNGDCNCHLYNTNGEVTASLLGKTIKFSEHVHSTIYCVALKCVQTVTKNKGSIVTDTPNTEKGE